MSNKVPEPHKPERHAKGWGFEDWINNREYCGKLLFFNKGKKCSFHYHEKKHETFFLFSGKMEVKISWEDDISTVKIYMLSAGDCLEIPIGLRHQMTALEDSNLFEFSTTHYDEDSKRIIRGD